MKSVNSIMNKRLISYNKDNDKMNEKKSLQT